MAVLQAETVVDALREASAASASRAHLLHLTAESLWKAGAPYTSVYLYMLHGKDLVLEAFSGRPTEHHKIEVGHGVCGTAVAVGLDQNVGDVASRSNYIACNLHTRSELVVLIRNASGSIVGQVDIDSDLLDPFTMEEEEAVRSVANALGMLL